MLNHRKLHQKLKIYVYIALITLFLAVAFPVTANYLPNDNKNKIILIDNLEEETPYKDTWQYGKKLYQQEKFIRAIKILQEAASIYAKQGNKLDEALSLNYLSLTYQSLSKWQAAEQAITQSLDILQQQKNPEILGLALNTQGSLLFARGKTEAALNIWQQAENNYKSAVNKAGLFNVKINQALAFKQLANYPRTKFILEEVNIGLEKESNYLIKAEGYRNLGLAWKVIGNLRQSQKFLNQSFKFSKQLKIPFNNTITLINLGNVNKDLEQFKIALGDYKQAEILAQDNEQKVKAQLQQLNLNVKMKNWQEAKALIPVVATGLNNLPASRSTVYSWGIFAESLTKIEIEELGEKKATEKIANWQEIRDILTKAIAQAKELEDSRAEAISLNQLGNLYGMLKEWQEAEKITQAALQIGKKINSADILIKSYLQLGRIVKQQGDEKRALAIYTEIFNILKSRRQEIVAINSESDLNFNESIAPIYRELVSLLLDDKDNNIIITNNHRKPKEIPSEKINLARQAIEALQLAELDNFFGDAAIKSQPIVLNNIDKKAAIIYPMVLPDRLQVIVSLPENNTLLYEHYVAGKYVENFVGRSIQSLHIAYSNQERLRLFQQLYDWLIKPGEKEFKKDEIETLVFVVDGYWRSIPMAALYDGKQYLVEKYNIALNQGLPIINQPRKKRQKLSVLTAALTEARQGFPPLPGVQVEVDQIKTYQANSQVILNQNFTKPVFEQLFTNTNFDIIHLATHGQFSSKADDTFLLTWEGRINVREFNQLLQAREKNNNKPIDLFVLSACQTAVGDKQASLGLAGIAARSGAGSTIATLWGVNDESTAKIMAKFYQELAKPNVSKAKALRRSQINLLKQPLYEHPFYWAPFILLGNWL